MMTTLPTPVRDILSWYESDPPGTLTNLARILMSGRLGGSGKLLILPVDQGFEHGPARSFAVNPPAYDPGYHFQLAVDNQLSAFAAPLGMLEAGARRYAGTVPLILKLNSANALYPAGEAHPPTQARTACVADALRLGCVGIGMTLYPGSGASYAMMEQLRAIAAEAKAHGLVVVVWSYPRGGTLSKAGETALDITAYATHMAALLGAHIIKVKLPSDHLEQAEARSVYEQQATPRETLAERVGHIRQAAFDGRRLVVFSGGASKDREAILEEARAIAAGGGHGSIVGRNAFQRPYEEACALLGALQDIYRGA